jgi:hypothetical protein
MMTGGVTTKGRPVATVKVITDHHIHVIIIGAGTAPSILIEVHPNCADNLGLRPQSHRLHWGRPQSHHQWSLNNANLIEVSPLFSSKMRNPWLRSLTMKDASNFVTRPKK